LLWHATNILELAAKKPQVADQNRLSDWEGSNDQADKENGVKVSAFFVTAKLFDPTRTFNLRAFQQS
jgi:hypothetical protein